MGEGQSKMWLIHVAEHSPTKKRSELPMHTAMRTAYTVLFYTHEMSRKGKSGTRGLGLGMERNCKWAQALFFG